MLPSGQCASRFAQVLAPIDCFRAFSIEGLTFPSLGIRHQEA